VADRFKSNLKAKMVSHDTELRATFKLKSLAETKNFEI